MTTSPARTWVRDFLLLALIWGSSFLFMRIAAQELGPLPTAAVRVTIAALFLWPILRMRGHAPLLRQHWKPIFFVGVLNSGIPFALYSFAVMHITTGLSSILNATVPLFGAIVAWLWLGDRPGLSRSLGLALGFAGARIDHGLAVLSTLVAHADRTCLVLGPQDVVFHAPPRIDLTLRAGDRLSLYPLAPVQGDSTGLDWPIAGLDFAPDGRIGTSNRVTSGPVRLTMQGRGMLVILPRARLDAALTALRSAPRWPVRPDAAAPWPTDVRGG